MAGNISDINCLRRSFKMCFDITWNNFYASTGSSLKPNSLSFKTTQLDHLLQEAAHQQEDTFQVHHSAMFHTSIFMRVMQLQANSKGSFEKNGQDMDFHLVSWQCPIYIYIYMGVSKNRGFPPKWMVYNGKPYKNGWFGGTIIFWKHPYIYIYTHTILSLCVYDHTAPSYKFQKMLGQPSWRVKIP